MKEWEKYVRKVVPYVPGEQPKEKVIKLNTNENPYPPAPRVFEALKELDATDFRKYPDPAASELVDAIASFYGVESENVFVGVGSDDVISMAFLTFFNSEKPILFPDISYSFYSVWADVYGVKYECPKLDENFGICAADYKRENGGIIFPNPNAPTSIAQPLEFIEDIVKSNEDSVVIIDEAYIDFGGESALELTKKYDNLLVVQTFSKSRSMAGMRIGYAIGNKKLIRAMLDVKYSINSYTMNIPSIKLGKLAIEDRAYFEECTGKIVATRERVAKELKKLGFVMPDSKANFLFASHSKVPAKELFEALKKGGIYVRYFPKERIDNFLRITIGTDEEMDAFIAFVKEYLEKR